MDSRPRPYDRSHRLSHRIVSNFWPIRQQVEAVPYRIQLRPGQVMEMMEVQIVRAIEPVE